VSARTVVARWLASAVVLGASLAWADGPSKTVMVILDEKTQHQPTVRGKAGAVDATGLLHGELMLKLMREGWSLVLPPPDAMTGDRRVAREVAKKAGASVVIAGRVRIHEHPPEEARDKMPKLYPVTCVMELTAASTDDGTVRAAFDAAFSMAKSGDSPEVIAERGKESHAKTAEHVIERASADAWTELGPGLAAHLKAHGGN
jgi:hypothetical protein